MFDILYPEKSYFSRGWEDSEGRVFFYEFTMDKESYDSFSKILEEKGYTRPMEMDGGFGDWHVENETGKPVYEQSKTRNSGDASFFYQASLNRLTAVYYHTDR